MRARSQKYAETIYGLVSTIQELDRPLQKRYGALCHRFPLVVRENGLVAALGFLAAKGDTSAAEQHLLTHFARVLGAQDPAILQCMAMRADLSGYKYLSLQALAAGEWFKRYAEGVLKVDATGEDQEEEGLKNA
jgi:CRISPR-associated protein Cmr5